MKHTFLKYILFHKFHTNNICIDTKMMMWAPYDASCVGNRVHRPRFLYFVHQLFLD